MYLNGYEIAAMVCASLTLVFIVVGLFTDYFEVGRIATIISLILATIICLILTVILCIAKYKGDARTKNELRSVIEENYKDCAFIEDNQFYSDGKLYQYRLDSSESKVIITCQDDNEKEASCFKLDD